MPTLENIDGASLVPDILGNAMRGYQAGRQIRSDWDADKKKKTTDELKQRISMGGPDAWDAGTELSVHDPEEFNNFQVATANRYKALEGRNKYHTDTSLLGSYVIAQQEDPQQQLQSLYHFRDSMAKLGNPTDEIDSVIALGEQGDVRGMQNVLKTGAHLYQTVNADKFGKGDDKTPASVQEYKFAQENGYTGSFDSWKHQAESGAGRKPPANYQWDPEIEGAVIPLKGGPEDPDVLEKKRLSKLKPVPATAQKAQIGNSNSLAEIDAAIAAVKDQPQAFGFKEFTPDMLLQRKSTSAERQARAKVGKMAAVTIHELTGATQAVGEVGRLKSSVKMTGDSSDAILDKLQVLRSELVNKQAEFDKVYTPDNYRMNGDAEQKSEAGKSEGGNLNSLWGD